MATYTIDKIEYDSNVYNLQDNVSGYITGISSGDVTTALGFTPYDSTNPSGYTTNTGTVTKVTAGTGLAIGSTAQGNFTTSGTINHTNSVTAQTTQAIYPIKIDAQGHISAYGTAVTPLTAASTLDATKLSGTIPSNCYTDTNTTYALSNALSSHKFTSTLTAGGSGSGTSTATMEFVAGTGITLTDDTTNKKITIASSVTNTDEKLKTTGTTNDSGYLIFGDSTTTAETKKFSTAFQVDVDDDDDEAELKIGVGGSIDGGLSLYSSNYTGPVCLWTNQTGTSSGIHLYLPNQPGTLALTSDIPTVPTITLNGSSTTSPSFYAPTSAGTNGYVLTSSGSGAPSWTSGSLTDQNVLQTELNNNDQLTYLIALCDSSSGIVTSGINKSGYLTFDKSTNTLSISGSGSVSAHTVEGAYLIADNGLTILKGASPWYEATITASNITANRSYSLPNNSGTFALTSDVFSSTTASLTTSGWSSNSQTVSVTGVTASNTVIVSPAPASYDAYCEAGIYCSAQGAGTLTFTCNTVPSSALTVNILYK